MGWRKLFHIDEHYWGVADLEELVVLTYTDGDTCRIEFGSVEEMIEYLEGVCTWLEEDFASDGLWVECRMLIDELKTR